MLTFFIHNGTGVGSFFDTIRTGFWVNVTALVEAGDKSVKS